MKKSISKIFLIGLMTGILASCTQDLLDQVPTSDLSTSTFWKTEADAVTGLMGAYSSIRPVFDRDYYFDGHGEYTRVRGNAAVSGDLRQGDAYQGADYSPSGYGDNWDKYFRYLYGGVNRANYVIENTRNLLATTTNATSRANLETVIGEARLLRGMVYFRLISMYGDVPYIYKIVRANSEVASMSRTPIGEVKDSILADFTYAFDKLPKTKSPGRAAKPAALAFRGKLQLYWACWNKNGWPELPNFVPDAGKATEAFAAAAADFKSVINDYGLTLFRGGAPGSIDAVATVNPTTKNFDALGKADNLPNYFYLFMPEANNDSENIMNFMHGGTSTGQGEELMRDFAGRSHEGSQCWVSPRYALADRYQSLTTGDFAPKLIPMNPTVPAANNQARITLSSAVNPQSYTNRDYRMKATIQWDGEVSVGIISLKATGMCPFVYNSWNAPLSVAGVNYTTYNTDGSNTGYVFRKFVRNYAGQGRSDGNFAWPVMRLADVYLMYAEATNEVNGPQADAIEVVNKVRRRGNLPDLTAAMIASKEAFFSAIEQERIVELVAEGHRGFDLRRWRALERVWGPPNGQGVQTIDTWGANRDVYYRNTSERTYQQNYIFRIPPAERDRNPNLTQNTPWL